MTARYPLVLNGTAIQEVQTGDTVAGLVIGTDVQAYDAQLADIAGLTPTDNGVIIGNGTNFVVESGATLKTSLGLVIGTDIQAYDADLTTWAGKTAPTGDVIGTSDSQTLTNKTLTNPSINNYTEGVVAIGTVTSSNTLSLTSGTVQTATLTASTACTFTMPTATAGKSFILLLKQAASTGNGTATFTGVKWATAGAPTITATAGKMDILTFVSDGTNWYGSYSQGYTP